MKPSKIYYVSKSRLYPAFAYATENPSIIRIRKDLPKSVKRFLLSHETYHIQDWQRLAKKKKEYNWILGEIRANTYGTFKHPLGALICAIMSLQPYRIKFYFDRIRQGE